MANWYIAGWGFDFGVGMDDLAEKTWLESKNCVRLDASRAARMRRMGEEETTARVYLPELCKRCRTSWMPLQGWGFACRRSMIRSSSWVV